jgi:hypothetical protein
MSPAVIYVSAKSGEASCPIEDCGLTVKLVVDAYGACRYWDGCSHFLRPERWGGKLMAGFADRAGVQ